LTIGTYCQKGQSSMKAQPVELTYEVELGPGERLSLPRALIESVGPGRWVITVQFLPARSQTRDHLAFLRSYGPKDEGLYDDCAAG
jgi:hypothetical protein